MSSRNSITGCNLLEAILRKRWRVKETLCKLMACSVTAFTIGFSKFGNIALIFGSSRNNTDRSLWQVWQISSTDKLRDTISRITVQHYV